MRSLTHPISTCSILTLRTRGRSPGRTLPPGSQLQTPVLEPNGHKAPILGLHLAVSTPSRSVSPASLELTSWGKQRGGPGGGVTPRIVSCAKGKGFKSSPMSPVERDTVG